MVPWGLQRGLVSPASVKALSGPWGARDQGVRAKGGAEAREARSASPSREWAADRGLSNFGCPRAAQGAGVPGFRGCFSIGASRAHPHLLKLIPFPDPPLPPALALNPLPHPLKCLDCESLDAICSRLCLVSRSCHLHLLWFGLPTPYFTHTTFVFSFSVTGDGNLK